MNNHTDRMTACIEAIIEHISNPKRPSASVSDVEAAEARLGLKFPKSYKFFLLNLGFSPWPDYIYGLSAGLPAGLDVVNATEREHDSVEPPLPQHCIAFSPDGWGNHYCLDTASFQDGECPVIFWDHEKEADQPLEPVFTTFIEWLEDQIETANADANEDD